MSTTSVCLTCTVFDGLSDDSGWRYIGMVNPILLTLDAKGIPSGVTLDVYQTEGQSPEPSGSFEIPPLTEPGVKALTLIGDVNGVASLTLPSKSRFVRLIKNGTSSGQGITVMIRLQIN